MSTPWKVLGIVGICGFLAGCASGGSQMAPTLPGSSTQSVSHGLGPATQLHHAPTPLGFAQTVAGMSRGPGWMSPEVATASGLVYAANIGTSSVDIFSSKGKAAGSITTGVSTPFGLYVDKKSQLYVANFGNGTVTVYKKGKTSPSKTLTASGSPSDVTVDSKGTVYVTDFDTANVYVYKGGATSPTSTLADPSGTVYWDAVDSKGNLYVNDYALAVYEYPGGTGTPMQISGITFLFPGGLSFDNKDDLFVCDQGNGSQGTISAYKKPYTGGPAYSFTYTGDVVGCMVDTKDKDIWGGVYPSNGPTEYKLPTGTVAQTFTTSNIYGVAVSPPSKI